MNAGVFMRHWALWTFFNLDSSFLDPAVSVLYISFSSQLIEAAIKSRDQPVKQQTRKPVCADCNSLSQLTVGS